MSFLDTDEILVKKVSDDKPLTKEQQREWIRCAEDEKYWMRTYVMVQSPKGRMLFDPRDYQIDMLDTMDAGRFSVIVAGRQSGKSTTLGIRALHRAIFREDWKTGITSYKADNCRDFLDRIKYAYENLPTWMKPAVLKYNQREIKFRHNSSIRVQVTKENTFRGFTLDEIYVDEFAFVQTRIAEEFWTSLLPSLSADGDSATTRLIIISTPNGSAGVFADIWFGAKNGKNGFEHFLVDYNRVPGRTESFKKSMIAKMGLHKYLQEFECAFISTSGTLVNSIILEGLPHIEPVSTFGEDLRIFVDSFAGRNLAMSCDVSEGIGQDYHAIQIIDIDTFEQVAEYQNNLFTQTQYVKEIIKIINFLYSEGVNELYYTVEANSVGQGVMRLLENSEDVGLNRATLISDLDAKRLGMLTTSKSKLSGCIELKDMIELRKLKINSDRLLTELKFFVRTGASFAAEAGNNDDLVMAMVLMMNMLKHIANYEDAVYDVMNEINPMNEEEEVWGIF